MAKIMLEDVFASKTQAKIITFFLQNQRKEFYQSELKQLLNESLGSLQYELSRLKRMGFLDVKRTKIRTYYKLNSRFFLLGEIKRIVSKIKSRGNSSNRTTRAKARPKKRSRKK